MSKIDKAKEFVGYLKVVFGVLVAIDMSSVAWLFQNSEELGTLKTYIASGLILCVTCAIILLNKKILNKIDEMEEL